MGQPHMKIMGKMGKMGNMGMYIQWRKKNQAFFCVGFVGFRGGAILNF